MDTDSEQLYQERGDDPVNKSFRSRLEDTGVKVGRGLVELVPSSTAWNDLPQAINGGGRKDRRVIASLGVTVILEAISVSVFSTYASSCDVPLTVLPLNVGLVETSFPVTGSLGFRSHCRGVLRIFRLRSLWMHACASIRLRKRAQEVFACTKWSHWLQLGASNHSSELSRWSHRMKKNLCVKMLHVHKLAHPVRTQCDQLGRATMGLDEFTRILFLRASLRTLAHTVYLRKLASKWDPKITTLPGLYLLSVGALTPLTAVLGKDLCNEIGLLSAFNLATFPLLYFFTFLYYTDTISTSLVLLMYLFHLYGRNFLSAASGNSPLIYLIIVLL
uniref:Dol-P-Glc:Glc(2)Man(9)GlcNAc(2)-PP-Dol alpha-1,2-glucosyltransferase n=1 Tax=Timema shepardi TaxID=629360 RepID=A0A7R9AWU6_TIMSH|nr:unnamed protein product [Timema shepardi]